MIKILCFCQLHKNEDVDWIVKHVVYLDDIFMLCVAQYADFIFHLRHQIFFLKELYFQFLQCKKFLVGLQLHFINLAITSLAK